MKQTTIKVSELTRIKVNQYKYKFGLDNHDQVIQRLFEIAMKIESADLLSSKLGASTKRGRSNSQKLPTTMDTDSTTLEYPFLSSSSQSDLNAKEETCQQIDLQQKL